MADWTDIATAALDVGSPIRSVDMIALRDNAEAVIQGHAAAPKATPWIFFSTVTAGSTTRFAMDYEQLHQGDTEIVAFHALVFCSGVLTMRCDHAANGDDSDSATMRFIKQRGGVDSQQGSWSRSANGTVSTRSVNVDVLPGDLLFVVHDRNATTRSRAKNFKLETNGEYLFAFGTGSLVLPTQTGA